MSGFNRFYNFSLRSSSISIGDRCWFAHFKVDGDFSQLFPFIQSTATDVVHYELPEYIQFRLDDIICALYPPDIVVSRLFYGREHALGFAQRLIDYLNELEVNKSQIKPDFKKLCRLHVPEILHFLPMTNCGECGFRTCMAFAGALSRGKAKLIMCTHFPEPVAAKIIYIINDQNSGKIRNIEVDSALAGVMISKPNDDQSVTQPQLDFKKGTKRSTGLMGNRDGIIFKISGREAEVLRLITEGFTNKEIAQILKVSHNTVKSHVVHIFNKLGVDDRTQAAVWAAQNELI
ncbi:putative Transcriptional regulator, LuxR family [Syntrophobacter sp. SbD1]|nr:putative Transcriptional regulator, LuxR family [Syntrophobacter sp. SbD1]